MSNNACAVPDGGEIGRAQALQAQAAGLEPSVHMNPVLLKPESDSGSHIVVRGRYRFTLDAQAYHRCKADLLPEVVESYDLLAAQSDLMLVEGAGGVGEINLRDGDIANLGFAQAVDIAGAIVGNIDYGGTIASLVGSSMVLSTADRRRIRGFIINRMRGDADLLAPALPIIEERTGWAGLGVIAETPSCRILPAEDSAALSSPPPLPLTPPSRGVGAPIRIGVPVLPRIANFDDCDPLRLEPDVELIMVRPPSPLPRDLDLILLPGSKSTLGDLAFLRAQGWHHDIAVHIRHGGMAIGICAGYQMLGRKIADPLGLEGGGSGDGLGHLSISTTLDSHKRVAAVRGVDCAHGLPVGGYEIHLGRMSGVDLDKPFLRIEGKPEGAQSPAGNVIGTSVHGLFAADGFRRAFLDRLRARPGDPDETPIYRDEVENAIDALADALEAGLDIEKTAAIAGLR